MASVVIFTYWKTMEIKPQTYDAVEFVALVQACVIGVLQLHKPRELVLIKIDNWFGQKWLHFSGKALGLVGVWRSNQDLTVPPFVPNRVRSERRFIAPAYLEFAVQNPVHASLESQNALHRGISKTVPGASLIWYSGGSRRAGRGSVMAYILIEDSYWTWYVELGESRSWGVVTAKGISENEFSAIK